MIETHTRILGIAPYDGMRTAMEQAAQAYPNVEMDIYTGDLEDGQAIVQQMPPNSYDCIISRGGTATLIRQVTDLPVVDIHISVYDVLRTMKLAENYPSLYAIVGFPSITEPANLVPDFVGLDYDAQVRNNRSYVGDYLFYVTLEYSDTVAEGKIIRQEPAAGELLEEGGTISLVVSKGPEMIEMPNVIGFTQEGAVKELESRGLVPSCFMVVNDGSYASGCVVSCSAEAGTSVEAGSVIVVYIAADPSVENVPATPEQPAASDNTAPAGGSGEAPAASMEYDTD